MNLALFSCNVLFSQGAVCHANTADSASVALKRNEIKHFCIISTLCLAGTSNYLHYSLLFQLAVVIIGLLYSCSSESKKIEIITVLF